MADLSKIPARKVAVLACMDARLDPAHILGLARGDAHVLRNAGGVVTEDTIRSLLLSQRLLATEEIMLLHHTDCGLAGLDEDELATAVEAETGVRPPFAFQGFDDVDDSVRQSIARLRSSPFIPRTERIRGYVYDVDTETLREVTYDPAA